VSTTWIIAQREFLQRIRNRGFWMSALGTPIMLLVIMFVSGNVGADADASAQQAVAPVQEATAAVGYVDQAGLLAAVPVPDALRAYGDEAEAAAALRAGQVSAFYVIPADYRESGSVRYVSRTLPTSRPESGFMEMLLANALVAEVGGEHPERLLLPMGPGGMDLALEQSAEPAGGGLDMMPFAVMAAIMVPLLTGGSLLLRSLSQEKESRIMEVLLVSIRPRQLLMGKLLGMGALIVVQYLGWVLALALVDLVPGINLQPMLAGLNLDGPQLLLLMCYAAGGFVLYAALMAGLGAITPDIHSSQNWVFVITLPMMIPMYFWLPLVESPQSALSVALSLIPWSAPISMVLRLTVAQVPLWQIVLSMAILIVTAILTIRLMARLFRAQVLLSGEPLNAARLLQALRA